MAKPKVKSVGTTFTSKETSHENDDTQNLSKRKRARIIIRNISYKATEDDLRKHFENYGKITEIKLLKRPDGKLVGCAFMQFEAVNQAAKAIFKCSNKDFLGRPIYVDWAVDKEKYEKVKQNNKLETIKDDESRETLSLKDGDDKIIKSEESDASDSDDEEENEKLDEKAAENIESDSDEDMEKNESDTEAENSSSDSDIDENKTDQLEKNKLKKTNSNDAKDGCTVFLKNVPFDAENDDIKELCKKYGPIVYALVNVDPVSGHSKGTAFVRFKSKESADLLLNAGNELVFMDTIIEPFPALTRNDIKEKVQSSKKKDARDSRNLYLAKEGLIMAGSKAADGVSASDMAKRHKLEQMKTQILKNLSRFVSRNRLSIHNLPLHYDDEKLKNLVIKFTKSKPHECRVMRENRPSVGYPNGKSKGFGFMSFKTHEEALLALRKLNNNPNVFGMKNRPIVAFSIEDRSVHNIKQRRIEKSKQNNPTFKSKFESQGQKKKNKDHDKNSDNRSQIFGKNEADNEQKSSKKNQNVKSINDEEFMGTSAKPGQTLTRMRSNKKIDQQSKTHAKKVTKLKRLEKRKKERLTYLKEKQEHKKENKFLTRKKLEKIKTHKSDKDNFSNLVEKYKNLINKNASAEGSKKMKKVRTKWYTDDK